MTDMHEKKSQSCKGFECIQNLFSNAKAWWIVAWSLLILWIIIHLIGGFGFRRWFDDSRFDRQGMMQGRWGPRGEFWPGEGFCPGQEGTRCGGNSDSCPFANQTGEQTITQQTGTGN
jgi:hypothetical protein